MTSKQEIQALKEQINDLQKILKQRQPVTVAIAKKDNATKFYSVNQFRFYTNKTTGKRGKWNCNSTYFNNLDDAKALFKIYSNNNNLGVRISERTAPKTWSVIRTVNPKA